MLKQRANAVDDAERFVDECNGAYAQLKADPLSWEQEIAEREVWDVTLADGLQEGK